MKYGYESTTEQTNEHQDQSKAQATKVVIPQGSSLTYEIRRDLRKFGFEVPISGSRNTQAHTLELSFIDE